MIRTFVEGLICPRLIQWREDNKCTYHIFLTELAFFNLDEIWITMESNLTYYLAWWNLYKCCSVELRTFLYYISNGIEIILNQILRCHVLDHGQLYTGLLSRHFFSVNCTRWELGTQITPRGWIFGTMIFLILKNSHQGLSNEGSNFILSSVEVGHWVSQTQSFFDKLPEITDFVLLQQSQNRASF